MERGRDLRAQLLALNQRRCERPDILDRSAIGEIAQSLPKRSARRDFASDQRELAANCLLLPFAFRTDDFDCLEQAESGLDADHQQIEDVGELARDLTLATARSSAQIDRWQYK